METSDTYCGYCKVTFTGPHPAREHYASKKHKSKAAVFSLQGGAVPSLNTGLGGPPGLGGTSGLGRPPAAPSPAAAAAVSQRSSGTLASTPGGPPNNEPYTFDALSGKGRCNLCDIELTSQQHANQHLSGKPHKKKEMTERYRQQAGNNPNAASSVPLRPPPTIVPPQSNIVGAERYALAASTLVSTNTQAVKPGDVDQASGTSRTLGGLFTTHSTVPEDSNVLGLRTLGTDTNLTDGMVIVDGVTWWQCAVCNKKMNTEDVFALHKESPAHKKKVEQKANLGCAGMSADLTVWRTCPLCQKRLNSIPQLKIHIQSHGGPPETLDDLVRQGESTQSSNVRTRSSLMHTEVKATPPTIPMSLFDMNAADNLRCDVMAERGQNIREGSKMAEPLLVEPKNVAEQHNTTFKRPSIVSDANSQVEGQVKKDEQHTKGDTLVDLMTGQPLGNTVPAHIRDLCSGIEQVNLISFDDDHGATGTTTSLAVGSSPQNLMPSNPLATMGAPYQGLLDDDQEQLFVTEGLCDYPGCYYHCDLCDKHLAGKRPMEDHLDSTGHNKKLSTMNGDTPTYTHCPVCDVYMNTAKQYRSHVRGKQHRSKMVRRQVAPLTELPLPVRKQEVECVEDSMDSLTISVPRAYQAELYLKIMADTDSAVCFLPTGTGKTFVAAMVVAQMLTTNPHHNVLFLVDRVLLVIQQAQFIRKELKDFFPNRVASETGSSIPRPVRVAALCGGQQDIVNDDMAPWQHDVIVATAGFYQNLLQYGSVRWAQHCLVVIDEVHHTIQGDHPFTNLLQHQHMTLPAEQRPKILGLTASPAGMDSIAKTQVMLRRLMDKLGGAKVVTVTKEVRELEVYRSSTKLEPRLVGLSSKEEELEKLVKVYLKACVEKIKRRSDFDDMMKEVGDPSIDNMRGKLGSSGLPAIDELLFLLDKITVSKPEQQLETDALVLHTKVICSGLSALEQFGAASAFFELGELQREEHQESFTIAKQLKLPYEPLLSWLQCNEKGRQLASAERDTDVIDGPMLIAIVDEITKTWNNINKPIIMVLVQRRSDAKLMAEFLQKSPQLQKRQITSTYIIGHGSGGSDGMSVSQQERRLSEITRGQHNVIVATSVAEEGIDLPACELVIQCDVPSSVTALVQIKGRARKSRSRYVVMCRHDNQKQDIEDLLLRERIMTQAIQDMVAKQHDAAMDTQRVYVDTEEDQIMADVF